MNKSMLIGRLGGDPVLRKTKDGGPVANFNIATNDKWTDKVTGKRVERTEWHRIVVFGGRAETVSKYLKKGSRVYVEGRNQTQKYTDKNGIDREGKEVLLTTFEFLDNRPQEDTGSALAEGNEETKSEENATVGQGEKEDAPY